MGHLTYRQKCEIQPLLKYKVSQELRRRDIEHSFNIFFYLRTLFYRETGFDQNMHEYMENPAIRPKIRIFQES